MKMQKVLHLSILALSLFFLAPLCAETTLSDEAPTNTTTTRLSDDTGVSSDAVKILSDLAPIPLKTYLYYEDTDITSNTTDNSDIQYIYSEDWNAQAGFTTGYFKVYVSGSPGTDQPQFQVAITATPFYLQNSTSVYGGRVSITDIIADDDEGNGAILGADDDNQTPAEGDNATYTYTSSIFASGYVFTVGQTQAKYHIYNGRIMSFKIKTAQLERKLPSGRYISTVTLAYSLV